MTFAVFLLAYALSQFFRSFLAVIAPELAVELSLGPQALGENRQRAGPAGDGQDDAFDQNQARSDPGQGGDVTRDGAEQDLENARAQNPEDDRVHDLDVEDGELQHGSSGGPT
jgi:hypothetical protein